MKIKCAFLFILFLIQPLIKPQNYDYWKGAPTEGNLIFSVYFINTQSGYAISTNNELFITSDAGTTWKIEQDNRKEKSDEKKSIYWSADIYCSAMKTEDGGANWTPYSQKAQEHFCQVYFKDPNVEYKIASEFLNTVSEKIFAAINNNKTATLIGKPQQCTEYYSNEQEGWAVGWCLKNFNQDKNIK